MTKTIKSMSKSFYLSLISLFYAPALFADDAWFPKVADADNITDGSRNMMGVTGDYVIKGLSLLLFITAVVTFIKFITTVQHGIEEAKKNEGSMVSFGTFAVMGITYLAVSIASGYVGYSMITKFHL